MFKNRDTISEVSKNGYYTNSRVHCYGYIIEAPKEKEQKGKAAEKKFYFITDLPIKKVRQ